MTTAYTASLFLEVQRLAVRDSNGNATITHLRVYDRRRLANYTEGHPPYIAVVTEQDDNPGMSVTNNAEALHAHIARAIGAEFDMVEHYPANRYGGSFSESFALVRMVRGHAQWSPMTRAQLEANVGGEFA